MKNKRIVKSKGIVFSCWSRKNYAIFASLKRIVKIAFLSVDICIKALAKNALMLSFRDLVFVSDITEYFIEEQTSELEILKINIVLESCKSEYSAQYKNVMYRKPMF